MSGSPSWPKTPATTRSGPTSWPSWPAGSAGPAAPRSTRPGPATTSPRWPPSSSTACCAPTGAARTAQSRWVLEVERWLADAIPGYGEEGEWYPGRPLLVTANDYELNLYNGDTGRGRPHPRRRAAGRTSVAATTRSLYAPVRLDAVQTVHAMTVHRAQGSQFRSVSFVVPPVTSPLLTRELLYTAVTRATDHVEVIASEAAIRRAIARPANRASGLRNRLAPDAAPTAGQAAARADRAARAVMRSARVRLPGRSTAQARQEVALTPLPVTDRRILREGSSRKRR